MSKSNNIPNSRWVFARLQANGALSRIMNNQLQHTEYLTQEAAERDAPRALAGMRPGHRESKIVLVQIVKEAEVVASVTLKDYKTDQRERI